MVFSSITFLFYFLPIVLGIYHIVPNKIKNLVLLIASLFFYFYGEPQYVVIMLVSIIITYVSGILIDKYRTKLELYKRALESATGKKVYRVYIYSTYMDKEILF